MARYTLKLHDNVSNKNNNIKLIDNDVFREKVDLVTIDRFINDRYIGDNNYESFKDKYELKEYLEKYYNMNISSNFSAYISYQSDKEEKTLELIYDDDKTIKYFSHMYLYYRENSNNYEQMINKVINNHVWKDFCLMFKNLIDDPMFYRYITKDASGKSYVTGKFADSINDYHNYQNSDDHDGLLTRKYAGDIILQHLQSYKTVRGIQLAINKYNNLKDMNDGLESSYLDSELYHQSYKMPLKETIYHSKKEIIKETNYTLSNEELNANIGGGYTSKADLARKIYEEEGYTLDDVMNDPELMLRLGYVIEEPIEEDISRRKRK